MAQIAPAASPYDKNDTSLARLANGSAVVGWRSAGALSARIVAADGTPTRLVDIPATRPLKMTLVALADGGWVAVWLEEPVQGTSQTSTTYSLRFRVYEANGDLRRDTVEVTGPGVLYWSVSAPSAVATPDGGFAVAWSGRPLIVTPYWAYLQRYDANGASTGTPFQSPPYEYSAKLAAMPDGGLVLASTTSESGGVLQLRRFDPTGTVVTPPVPVAGTETAAPSYLHYELTTLAGGNVAIAWGRSDFNQSPTSLTAQALTSLGVPLSPQVPITTTESTIDAFSLLPRGTGFSVLPQAFIGYSRGALQRLGEVQVGLDGTAGTYRQLVEATTYSVSPTTGATTGLAVPGFAVAASDGGHVMAGYERAISGGAQVVLEGR